MAVVVIVVLIARQDAVMGLTDPMPILIIMDRTEQNLPTAAYLVTVFVIMVCISE